MRYRPLWLAMGWGMVALVFYLSLTPRPVELRIDYGDKYLHLLAYFVLMWWFQQLYPARGARLLLLCLFTGMGVGLEYLQGISGMRVFDPADMVANGLGALLAWTVGWLGFASLLPWVESLLVPKRQ
ncbi:MAG TPA: VanZ family protein [Gammaproteobacteria bacterium]|nr:VanZ family protein [Gammaproteobacteria bacterium]